MVLGMTLAMVYLRRRDPRRAARALATASDGYRGFQRLCRQLGVEKPPEMLGDFEGACRDVLSAFEPPIVHGVDPVRTLARTARALPRRRRKARPRRVIDALDALITAGRARPGAEVERRVVHDIARMLGARVLLHYEDGHYHTLRPQTEHTLSTWSIHRLARETRVVARRVRPRPEFWRPDQRRPGALLSFPIGQGVACVSRRRPFRRREIRAVRTVLRFLEARRHGPVVRAPTRHEGARAPRLPLAGEGLIGQSTPWKRVLRLVARVAGSDCAVLLTGETGTGKERLARAIHSSSNRSQGPFVPVNCGALAPDLLHAELFGHIRGAFTGAHRAREGLARRAHRGTLFLDEIAEAPPALQVALLRLLEEKSVVPVGSARSHRVQTRFISATHKDLEAEIEAGRFRSDLYHRLDVVHIRVPPLRERGSDLALLAEHLLAKTPEGRSLHRDALAVLQGYDWPGNVRELDNVLRAAALLSDDDEITPETLGRLLAQRRARDRSPAAYRGGPRAERVLLALGSRWLSAPVLARELGVSTRTMNRELANLVDQGLVESHGAARARRYHRAELG
jgi:DNA-binding NtrC family response regulator